MDSFSCFTLFCFALPSHTVMTSIYILPCTLCHESTIALYSYYKTHPPLQTVTVAPIILSF